MYGCTLTPIDFASDTVTTVDILAKVGTSTSPTAIGTKAVTGIGFQPKLLLPFGVPQTSDGTGANAFLSLGAGTGIAQATVAATSISAVTTSQTYRRHSASKVFTWPVSTGSLLEEASLSSFDADGFTLNWSTASMTQYILNHICLGGADLEVSITQQQMNGTNADQSFAHGLTGGAPTAVLLFSAINSAAPPITGSVALFSIGAWAVDSQFGASIRSSNGVTTTFAKRILANDHVLAHISHTSGLLRAMAIDSVDATNVNVTYPVTSNTDQNYIYMIAIRGAKAQVGTFDCNGSTDPLTIACSGITPKLFLPVMIRGGADNPGVILDHVYMSIGGSDGTNNVSCGISDQNGVTTTNARRYQSSTSLVEYALNGTKAFEATASFDGESVILDPTTLVDSNHGQGAYLILGS